MEARGLDRFVVGVDVCARSSQRRRQADQRDHAEQRRAGATDGQRADVAGRGQHVLGEERAGAAEHQALGAARLATGVELQRDRDDAGVERAEQDREHRLTRGQAAEAPVRPRQRDPQAEPRRRRTQAGLDEHVDVAPKRRPASQAHETEGEERVRGDADHTRHEPGRAAERPGAATERQEAEAGTDEWSAGCVLAPALTTDQRPQARHRDRERDDRGHARRTDARDLHLQGTQHHGSAAGERDENLDDAAATQRSAARLVFRWCGDGFHGRSRQLSSPPVLSARRSRL